MTNEEPFESDYEGEEEDCIEWTSAVQLSRTMAHIIDYKMFIAARLIQSFWRAYRERKRRHQRWQGCITIQRWWRGFRLRRQLCDLVEQRLQNAYYDHINRMATRIQALFRGWLGRRHIHDMVSLTRVQIAATEDVLHCLVLNLHHLKRTEQIPGIVSVQEAMCVSKMEHLIATMAFRFYNGRLTSMVNSKKARQEAARMHFRDCSFQTVIPYAGPDSNSCTYHAYTSDMNVGNELLDLRMNDIVRTYQRSQRSEHLRKLYSQTGLHKRNQIRDREREAKLDFCNTVILSMRRWKEFRGIGFKDILDNPERQQRFFKSLGIVLGEYGINCSCVVGDFPDYHCPEANIYSGSDG